jgi:hypothetical protein
MYNDQWGVEECNSCPKGTYQEFDGASLQSDCLFCVSGTYAPEKASTSCDVCPIQVDEVCGVKGTPDCVCRVGSEMALPSEVPNSEINVKHHELNVNDPDRADNTVQIIFSVVFSLLGFITLMYFILRVGHIRTVKVLRRIDIFMADQHISRDMFSKKARTTSGGLCTIWIFCMIGAIYLAVAAVPYLALQKEVRTTIPKTVVSKEVIGEFKVRIILEGYQGKCTSGASCDSSFQFTPTNFVINNALPISCVATPTTCQIEWYCTRCSITAQTLSYQFYSESSLAAQAITWEVYTLSARGSPSLVGSTIYPSKSGAQFRGIEKPTVIQNEFLLNVARIDAATLTNPSLGYMVHHKEITTGSEYVGNIINDDGLSINFLFTFSNFVILDSADQKFYDAFLTVLFLGTIPGIVTLMKMTYRIVEMVAFSDFAKNLVKKIHVDRDSYRPVDDHEDDRAALIVGDYEDEEEMSEYTEVVPVLADHTEDHDHVSLDANKSGRQSPTNSN